MRANTGGNDIELETEQTSTLVTHPPYIRPLELSADAPRDVHVWLVNVDCAMLLPHPDACLLSSGEHVRAQSFVRQADAVRFITVRTALRRVLSSFVGQSPKSIRIEMDTRGRPALVPPVALDFNVSHSGSHGAIIVSHVRRVGIDIEQVTPSIDWWSIENIVTTDTDRRVIRALPEKAQLSAFFESWCAKEAVLKAHGIGLGSDAIGLETLSVLPRRGAVFTLSQAAGSFAAVALRVPPTYTAAVAWEICRHAQPIDSAL